MKISVKAKPSARDQKVEKISDTEYCVSVKEPAQDGRANNAIISSLARYFKIAPSRIKLIRGKKSKTKVFEL